MGNIENKDLRVTDKMYALYSEMYGVFSAVCKEIENDPGNQALRTIYGELLSTLSSTLSLYDAVRDSYFSEENKEDFLATLSKQKQALYAEESSFKSGLSK